MFRSDTEPTIDEILRDPTVRALMRADRVDATDFEAGLRNFGRRAPPVPVAVPESSAVAAARRCWC